MKLLKSYIWLFIAYWVKTFGIRNQAWFNEHVSRVRQLKAQLAKGPFDYATYARHLLSENKNPTKANFIPYVDHSGELKLRVEVEDRKNSTLQLHLPTTTKTENSTVHLPPPPSPKKENNTTVHLHLEPSPKKIEPSTLQLPLSTSTKLIAFYLPQFHSFPENDTWHGRGFTEWTNVTRALPQFLGHHQPQLPIDVGFYDLSSPKVMYRQVELAKNYGIYGFCFHYYWFTGGKRLLEKPLFNWLEHQDLDLPFMLCWANENWSKLWDGGNREVLMRQESRVEDAADFFRDILPFLKDDRYIRIDGKPHLILYRPNLFTKENCLAFCAELKRRAVEAGLGGLFLSMVGHENFPGTAADWGFDAMVEFPPMRLMQKREYAEVQTNPDCKTLVYDMGKMLSDDRLIDIPEEGVPIFRGIFPGWDNTSRKAYSNASCYPLTPAQYSDWLRRLIAWESSHNTPDKQFIFVNAWNEWAEGAHLEPDSVRGYDYLEETWQVLNG